MKKLAIGCGIAMVVLVVVGSVGAWLVYRTVKARFGDTFESIAALRQVPEIERQVRNTAPFAPPDGDRLTSGQLDRFVAVQTAVRDRIGAEFAAFERRYKALIDKKEATALDLPELLSAYKDLAKTWLAAKQAQVDALNAQGLSVAEYRWVRNQTYRAVGMPLMAVDVSEIIDKAMRGENLEQTPQNIEGSIGPSGPPENQKLIEPYKKRLEDNAALAVFGL